MFDTIDAYRRRARQFCEWATGGALGNPQGSARYGLVTEGREMKPGRSSSCAELPHAMLQHLGIRSAFVNRDANRGWHPGLGIAMLCGEEIGGQRIGVPDTVRKAPAPGSTFGTGDIHVIWNTGNDAHTYVALEQDGPIVHTADFGQPGGALCTWTLSERALQGPSALFRGTRQLHVWLPLDRLLACAEARGELVEPSELPPHPAVRLGDRGPDVADLQRVLGQLDVDGAFGPATLARLRAVAGVDVCDAAVWASLGAA